MQIFPFALDYYENAAGRRLFKEWLAGMKDVNGRAKIRIRLDRARLGTLGDHKHVGSGVWEMRIDYGPGYRVYFAKEGNQLLLLLIGGDKSSQDQDIDRAQGYGLDHLGRKKHGTTDKLSS